MSADDKFEYEDCIKKNNLTYAIKWLKKLKVKKEELKKATGKTTTTSLRKNQGDVPKCCELIRDKLMEIELEEDIKVPPKIPIVEESRMKVYEEKKGKCELQTLKNLIDNPVICDNFCIKSLKSIGKELEEEIKRRTGKIVKFKSTTLNKKNKELYCNLIKEEVKKLKEVEKIIEKPIERKYEEEKIIEKPIEGKYEEEIIEKPIERKYEEEKIEQIVDVENILNLLPDEIKIKIRKIEEDNKNKKFDLSNCSTYTMTILKAVAQVLGIKKYYSYKQPQREELCNLIKEEVKKKAKVIVPIPIAAIILQNIEEDIKLPPDIVKAQDKARDDVVKFLTTSDYKPEEKKEVIIEKKIDGKKKVVKISKEMEKKEIEKKAKIIEKKPEEKKKEIKKPEEEKKEIKKPEEEKQYKQPKAKIKEKKEIQYIITNPELDGKYYIEPFIDIEDQKIDIDSIISSYDKLLKDEPVVAYIERKRDKEEKEIEIERIEVTILDNNIINNIYIIKELLDSCIA